nr:villin-1 isoform X1 [Tanacetum cinerariifolium]
RLAFTQKVRLSVLDFLRPQERPVNRHLAFLKEGSESAIF